MMATSLGDLVSPATNPFYTPAYSAARASLGNLTYALKLGAEGTWPPTPVFITPGRLTSTLEIPSLPAIEDDQSAADAIRELSRRHRVGECFTGTYASPSTRQPALGTPVERFERSEFLIDLRGEDELLMRLSRTHRQRVRQAIRNGVELRRSRNAEALREHARLIGLSMSRRQARGEEVPDGVLLKPLQALLDSGAGELFQSLHSGTVVASMLLLLAPAGAYDQSSGSAPEGMRIGAMHSLIVQTADLLRREGLTVLNLGGARPEEEGLRAFKCGFGCEILNHEATRWDLATPYRRAMVRGAAAMKRVLGLS